MGHCVLMREEREIPLLFFRRKFSAALLDGGKIKVTGLIRRAVRVALVMEHKVSGMCLVMALDLELMRRNIYSFIKLLIYTRVYLSF